MVGKAGTPVRLNLYNAEFIKSVSDIEGVITDPLPKIVLGKVECRQIVHHKRTAGMKVLPGK